MISIEHANRVPDEFYASQDERRVYLPTDNIFVHGGSSLRPGGDIELMRVSALLSLPDKPRVQIEVHTDAGGSRAKQLELSRRRAANIRSWLLARGHIDAQRFDVRGVGSSRPVVPPDGSYTAQSPNRRLEIRVVE
jgi:outer membrane protein OmpA-like peptidoglycan-associated protein